MLPPLPLLAVALIFAFLPPAITQPSASPPVLNFPPLTPTLPGTLHGTAVDSSTNLYTTGQSSTTAFIQKRTSTLSPLWTTHLPTLPNTPPALAISPSGHVFALAPATTPTDPAFAHLTLYELLPANGTILHAALVERVRLLPPFRLRCILASARPAAAPLVYLTYIVQDGVSPTSARTRLVQMARPNPEEALRLSWAAALTPAGRAARSAALAEDKAGGRVVVVEVSTRVGREDTDSLSVYAVDEDGVVVHATATGASAADAWVADVAVDDAGALYVAEGPALLHRMALRELNGDDLLARLWNVTDTEVVDMTVLRNGTTLYVLSNGEGFRNEGNQIVRTKTPVLSVYNASGATMFRSEYAEPIPDAERQMFSLSLVDPENKCDAVLGGFFRLAGSISAEKEVSIGLFTFPSVLKVNASEGDDEGPVLIDPNTSSPNSSHPNGTLIAIGVSVAVAVFLTIVATALFIIYKNKHAEAEDERKRIQAELEADNDIEDIPPRKENTVLV